MCTHAGVCAAMSQWLCSEQLAASEPAISSIKATITIFQSFLSGAFSFFPLITTISHKLLTCSTITVHTEAPSHAYAGQAECDTERCWPGLLIDLPLYVCGRTEKLPLVAGVQGLQFIP